MKKIMFNDRYGLTAAVLAGRKTMTRRIEFDEYLQTEATDADAIGYGQGCCEMWWDGQILHQIPSRYKVGEVVAVAQKYSEIFDKSNCVNPYGYEEEDEKQSGWTNKMFVRADQMPHRIRITDVRVERLQDISDEDCIKEGVGISATDNIIGYPLGFRFNYFLGEDKRGCRYMLPREAFAALIDKVSGRGTWERNPWVVVYEFELIESIKL